MKTKDSRKQSVEMIKEKPSFVFYRSYYEAIQTLSSKNRLAAYDAIARYALYREETKDLPIRVLPILTMAIPNIDANHQKYFRRIKGEFQTNPKDTSAFFEVECAKEVLLPNKIYKVNTIENEADCFNDEGGEFES
jgi:hypothetical protein